MTKKIDASGRSTKAFILDLDGTLFDSVGVWQEIDRQFFREQGMEVPEGVAEKVSQMSIQEWAEFFTTEYHIALSPKQIIYRIEEIACDYYNRKVEMKPYLMEFLDFLDQWHVPYGIATAGYASATRTVLNRYGLLERVQFILTGKDVPSCKRTPEIYLKACHQLGSLPEHTYVAEDSLHCIQSAKSGGFLTIAVHDSHTRPEDWHEMQRISDLAVTGLDGIIQHFMTA